jgi:hypothetical protein
MVILKCIGDRQFYREKVIMPTELYWFEAPEDARLEIWTMSGPGQILHVRGDVRDYIVKDKPQASTLWAC